MTMDSPETISGRFKATARRYPGRVAVADETGAFSYNELWEASHRVRDRLLQNGAKPGDRVALFFEQGRDAVAATLGTLEAGCCFVPLDADDPESRLEMIVDDCQPAFVVSGGGLADRVRQMKIPQQRILALDQDQDQDQDQEVSKLGPSEVSVDIMADSLAYILYTSGSTGRPKGVCQSHRSFLHFVDAYCEALQTSSEDRLSMLFTMSFSAANLDIFSALSRGAGVHLFNVRRKGLHKLHHWLVAEGITVLHAPRTMLSQLLKSIPHGFIYDDLRAVDIAGEALYASDMQALAEHLSPHCICFNHLAATEASVIAMHRIDTGRDYGGHARMPVGRPPAGVEVRIVNEDGSRADDNEPGLIVVRSPHVVKGYLNRPDLNKQVIREDANGVREYWSGDYGCMDGNGDLIHLGRADTRVKVNGYSVDMGEIEAVLLTHERVENAVAVAAPTIRDPLRNRLSVYVVPVAGSEISETILRQFLAAHLPQYMMPAHMEFLDALPVTDTGKINRREILAMASDRQVVDKPAHEQHDGTVERLVQLYQQILERADIDPGCGFFEQGGDSLGATDLIESVEQEFGIALGAELLGKDLSVHQLAARVHAAKDTDRERGEPVDKPILIPLRVEAGRPNLFLVHGRNGRPFVSPHVLDILALRFSVYAIRARGTEPGELPHLSVEGMAADYIQQIRDLQREGPFFIFGICAGGVVATDMARQLVHVGETVAPVTVLDPAIAPLDLQTPASRRGRMADLLKKYGSDSDADDEALRKKLHRRKSAGRIHGDEFSTEDIHRVREVKTAFAIALTGYQPHPFDGDVLAITSYRRLRAIEQGDEALIRGNVRYFCVALRHDEAIASAHALFTKSLEQCMEYAIHAVSGSGPETANDAKPGGDADIAMSGFRRSRQGRNALVRAKLVEIRGRLKQVVARLTGSHWIPR